MKPFFSTSIYGKLLVIFFTFFCISQIYAKPLHFIPNYGQWEDEVIARANINSGWFWMDKNGFTYLLYDGKKINEQHTKRQKPTPVNTQVIKVIFEGADFSQSPVYEQPTSQYYNFFLDREPSGWRSGIYGYHKIYFSNVYPEIDFVLYASGDALKYDFIVKPGGNPEQIKISYKGQNNVSLNKNGDLQLQTLFGEITERAPLVYQQTQISKKKIKSAYNLAGNKLEFNIKSYDKNKNLIIDPELIFGTFSGSHADNFGYTATYDQEGNGYSGGTVFAPQFPVTPGAFQTTFGGGNAVNSELGDIARDIGILKYSPDGSQLLYCTFLGGNKNEDPHSMVVNNKNELVVFGNSFSANFPVTTGSYDETHNGEADIIVAKLSTDGKQLTAGTFIGGSYNDALNGYEFGEQYLSDLTYNYGDTYRGEVITDNDGNIYIATVTSSDDFPVKNGFQTDLGGGFQDGCVLKLNADLSQLVWSTYLGGNEDDATYSLYRAKNGNIYTCGGTNSADFLKTTVKGAYTDPFAIFMGDGFVACISEDGSKLLYSSYFGTQGYDQCFFVQLDNDENVFVTGQSNLSDELPVTSGLYTNLAAGQFIAKFSPQLDKVLLCTTFGSNRTVPDVSPAAFLVDECGQIYFSGWGGGANADVESSTKGLDVTDDAYQPTTDGSDFYLAVFNHELTELIYATFYGGSKSEEHVDGGTSRFDKRGVVYQSVCAGCGGFSDFPTTENAWSRKNNGKRPNNPTQGGCNNALFKMDVNTHPAFSFIVDTCALIVQFRKDSISSDANLKWSFGDGQFSTEVNPAHTYKLPGIYPVTVYTNYGTECQDTASLPVDVASKRGSTLTLYNVITPNNDGLNEYFYIPELDAACEEYELKIYNRWGEYMFNQKGKYLKWFGTNLKGKDAVEGVYFYVLKSPVYGEFKGTITVLR